MPLAAAALDPEDELIEEVDRFALDPLGWAYFAFPWGEPGELEKHSGPRPWQAEALDYLGRKLREGYSLAELMPVLMAIASGHGIGKSAFLGMIASWAMSTREDTKVVLTANTEPQMRTKTWPEICKWFRLSITAHWFKIAGTTIHSVDPERAKTWRMDAVTWSENNTEAFAGLHNQGKRILILYDEASAIADKVWDVTEGALTDEGTEIIWLVFGNPTRPSGRFYDCFNEQGERWWHRNIDSRTVPGTNTSQAEIWLKLYGEDHDFFRVRVRGMFPRSGSMQFIPTDHWEAAVRREATSNIDDPLILGVDIARFGEDETVLRFRRGLDGRSISPIRMRGANTMQVAARVAGAIDSFNVDMAFVDETGIGAGVVDRLLQLNYGGKVIGVNFGAGADRPVVADQKVANKRAEMAACYKEWLRAGGAIDNHPQLRKQTTGIEYGYERKSEAILLERKDDYKQRTGDGSPDDFDAAIVTFAHPVAKKILRPGQGHRAVGTDYNPYDQM
jgi:hypothetical protein